MLASEIYDHASHYTHTFHLGSWLIFNSIFASSSSCLRIHHALISIYPPKITKSKCFLFSSSLEMNSRTHFLYRNYFIIMLPISYRQFGVAFLLNIFIMLITFLADSKSNLNVFFKAIKLQC